MNPDTFYDQISNQYAHKLPFVAYRKPNEGSVKAMLQKDDALHIALDLSKSGFVFAPFDHKHQAIIFPVEHSEAISSESVMMSEKNSTNNDVDLVSEKDKASHIKLVQKAIETIKNNDLSKVVLSRKETVSLLKNNPIKIFKELLFNYPTAFVYCWYHPNVGLWLGATPETLIKVEGNRFNTMALAGTQHYNGSIDVDWKDKEIEEQQIVTDFIVKTLQPLVSSITVSKVETVKAGDLLHLKTNITGVLDADLKSLINNIHPTPAICGFPQETAKQFILENENYKREFYTGFLGELNLKKKQGRNTNTRNVENNAYAIVKNTSELFVNLRCMKLETTKAHIFVGGGITKDSIPENEWLETANKTKTMKRVIVF